LATFEDPGSVPEDFLAEERKFRSMASTLALSSSALAELLSKDFVWSLEGAEGEVVTGATTAVGFAEFRCACNSASFSRCSRISRSMMDSPGGGEVVLVGVAVKAVDLTETVAFGV
jgi:hypothetical protein